MSKIKRLRTVLTGAVCAAVAVATLPVLATTAASAATDPLGGQPGPVTLSPTMSQDGWQPTPPAGTSVADFMRHPVLSWTAITTLPVTTYRVQISPNANFTNNTVTLPAGGVTTSTQYDLPQTLPHGSYFWRVRGEDTAGHATNWAGTSEGNYASTWQFTKTWTGAPTLAAAGSSTTAPELSWSAIPDASAYQIELSNDATFPPGGTGAWAEGALCDSSFTADPTCVDNWIATVTYAKGAQVVSGGYIFTSASDGNQGSHPVPMGPFTINCTTNHTSWTPYSPKVALNGGSQVAEGSVYGVCDGGTATMTNYARANSNSSSPVTWFTRVRGLDQTSAAATAAEGSVACNADGTDCSAWSPVMTYVAPTTPTAFASVLAQPANLKVSCSGSVTGSSLPLCYDTPTMSWDAVPFANAYFVEVAVDPSFTVDYRTYLAFDHQITPRDSFLDNQAGQSYYWRVVATDYDFASNLHGATSAASSASFHKASAPLPKDAAAAFSTPGHDGLYVTVDNNEVFGAAVRTARSNQLTFHWDDLLQYEQQAAVTASQEAKEYRLEYSTTGNWLDDTTTTTVTTDATHWTKLGGPLADGGYYWRVAAVDGSGNLLSWSAVQTVVKGTVSPTVAIADTGLLAPTSAVTLQFQAPVSGVTSASLGLKTVGGANIPGHVVWPAPTPSLATFTPDKPLLPGQKVTPWVTSAVVDLAGNPARVAAGSSTVDPTVDSLSAVIKQTWSKLSTGKASGGSYAKAAGARDQLAFSFTGSKVALVGVGTPDGGYATVSVDGVPRKTVNFYAKKAAYGKTYFSALLSEGPHLLTVTVKGSHAKSSAGNAVNVDALRVDGRVLQQSVANQTWSLHRSTDAFMGSYNAESSYLSTWHGSKPTLSTGFAGTAVRVVGCKSPDSGEFAVYVDGKLKLTSNGFQKFTSCNKTLAKVKNLKSGTHTVAIVPLGVHGKGALGTKVSVDAVVAG